MSPRTARSGPRRIAPGRSHHHALAILAALSLPLAAQDEPAAAPSSPTQLPHDHAEPAVDGPFAPRITFVGDFVLSWGGEDAREAGADGFLLRSAELGISGSIERVLELHGYVFFDEEEVEIEEAYAVARDWLPHRFSLRGGLYNIDFGKQSPLHDHDLSTLDKAGAVQEYLGGTLRGTGVELRWGSPLTGNSSVRASAGVLQSAEGDSHAVLGPAAAHEHDDEDDEEDGPIRDVEDFAFTARAAAVVGLTERSTLEFGASGLHAPTREFGVDETDERDIDQTVLGLDVTWTTVDEATGRGLTLQGEWLHSDADFGTLDDGGTPGVPGDDTFTVAGERASGFSLLCELRPCARFALGASGGVWEHAEDAGEESSDLGVFASWMPNEHNRLRLEVRSYADLPVERDGAETPLDFVAVSLQWTVILGGHDHEHAGGQIREHAH